MPTRLNSKFLFVVAGVFVLIGGIIASMMVANRSAAKKSTPPAVIVTAPIEKKSATVPTAVATIPVSIKSAEKAAAVSTVIKTSSPPPDSRNQSAKNSAKPKKEIQDPTARAALSFVGADSEAEQYWAAAINDPNLPANERKDLIEDLNEDGLSDPKHPGPQDLSLILSRLQLIEQLAPASMDQVNADAFQEAYKDLVNLASGGTPQ